jgi:RNA polymerase sigma factor (TIGR02999 family)
MTPSQKSITQLLIEWREGDETARDELMPLVYNELRRMTHRYMGGERPGLTPQTSDLLNECYLRVVDHEGMHWENRAHFHAVAPQAMRRILIDRAHKRRAQKRNVELVDLDQAAVPTVATLCDEMLLTVLLPGGCNL